MGNKLKGGLGDKISLGDIAKKHKVSLEYIKKQLQRGIKVEMEHTNDKRIAREIATDHLVEDAKYYIKLEKIEAHEQMSDASGSFEAPISMPITKRSNFKITKEEFIRILNEDGILDSGQYDVPFGGGPYGRKDPLKIEGEKSIVKSKAVSDPNFPKWGGPGGIFIKIKDKCKKFPYCNQGDINAIEILKESIDNISEKYGIPKGNVEKIVLKEIRDIFI